MARGKGKIIQFLLFLQELSNLVNMCGIFGYCGPKNNAGEIVAAGLKRLEYRGYDSWGIGMCTQGRVQVEKRAGKISDVESFGHLPFSHMAIAHTRWATTGAVSDINAHPHLASDGSFALAQNGIVENYLELKADLGKKGYKFNSETDTEVIVRLIEDKKKQVTDLEKAIRLAFKEIAGRNTIILVTNNEQIFAARNGSPLIVGVNQSHQEMFLSSDVLSVASEATKTVMIENGQLVVIDKKIKIVNIESGTKIPIKFADIGIDRGEVNREGFDHFMLKEIYEAPKVLKQIAKQDGNKYQKLAMAIKRAKNVYTIGSGGAGVAAAQVAFYLRSISKIKAVSLVGADAKEYGDLFGKNDIILAISQSGETADVLEILELAKKRRVKIASFVNMPGSMITRLSDYPMMSESGPEICVMSTKTFDAQVAFGYVLAKTVRGEELDARKKINNLANEIEKYLRNETNHLCLQKIATGLSDKHDVFLLAKYQNFHIIREGMVKVIEAAYKHGHALPAGDLKHYVITLMEPGVAVIAVVSNDKAKNEVLNAVDEVSLRGASVIGIGPEKYKNFNLYIPVPDCGETSAIMNLIPLQLLAYYMAIKLGNNVDKPRNIAKSVTVK
jgi:glutamine---fructose-6-phosphate transaminase (isomerizing)